MTDLKFTCPHCQQHLEASEELLGQTVECPSCKGQLILPRPSTPPPVVRTVAAPPTPPAPPTHIPGTCPLCGNAMHMPEVKSLYRHMVCRKCFYSFAFRRQIAFLLDVVGCNIIAFLMCIPLVILSDSLHIYYETAGFIFFTLFVSIANLLILLKDGCWSGQSVGKKLCGVKVIDETTGEPGGIGASFKRNLPTLIPVAPLLIAGELWNGHRTGDRWANTKVIWKKYSGSLVFAPTHWNVHIALHKKC